MRRIIVVAGVTVAVLLAGYAAAPWMRTLPTTPLSNGWGLPTTPAVPQGTTVTDAGLSMTVTHASELKTIELDHPNGPWLVVKLHVSATSGKPALFDPMFQQVFIDGREYQPYPVAAESIYVDAGSAASLSPGSQTDVVLAFAVWDALPLEAKTIRLVLRGDVTSPGAVVSLTTR
jgi:hypothetical protein